MRLGPSTSTSCTVPTSASLRARACALDDLDQALEALALDVLRHLVGHVGRLGAAARRVDEGEGVVVADLLADVERLAEVVLGLAREADDEVGRQRDVRHRGADAVDEGQVALARVGAAHRLEHARGARLQRQVQVLADRRRTRPWRRSRRRACPWGAGSCSGCARCRRRVERAQQLGEREALLARQVAAVGVDVLAEQGQLAHAVGGQALDLGDHVGGAAASARGRARRGTMQYAHVELQPIEICSQAWAAARGAAAGRRRSGRRCQKARRGRSPPRRRRSRRGGATLPGPKAKSTNGYSSNSRSPMRLRPAAADHDRPWTGRAP